MSRLPVMRLQGSCTIILRFALSAQGQTGVATERGDAGTSLQEGRNNKQAGATLTEPLTSAVIRSRSRKQKISQVTVFQALGMGPPGFEPGTKGL
ncbi:MAG TPA: hypothetical protein VFS20_13810 [Longimicrobium sp.]|nr:hypothetical protein [Longimicrobium sp.]